ncbi:MAG: hypothetical protein LBB88_10990 [Planctomycetaceae bacterium]|jgi:hypothetical protein|nr:hypothetical protein [Planctomycetaceae bacterium]
MDKFSQQKLKCPATIDEHAIRKAEFDKTIGELLELQTRNKSNLVMAINEIYCIVDSSIKNYKIQENNDLLSLANVLTCIIVNSLILLIFKRFI